MYMYTLYVCRNESPSVGGWDISDSLDTSDISD